jgi:hypothetical protein
MLKVYSSEVWHLAIWSMFWDVKLCDLIHLFSPEDEGSMVVQNTGLRINIDLGSLHIDNKWGLHCKMSIAYETAICYNSLIHNFT